MKKSKKLIYFLDLLGFVLLLAADQFSKVLAVNHLGGGDDKVMIDGVFVLHYLENRGAAFSMLQDAKVLFVFATVVMMTAILYVLTKAPVGKRFTMWHVCLTMIAAGGIGNLIDRLRFSYVIDFLYFSLIDFPVFNVADICVTVGVALLIFCILFVWKEDDLKFLELKLRKE